MKRTITLAVAIVAILIATATAQTAKAYGFISHAAFFSVETKQGNLLDPQVFVADAAAHAGTGPQGIAHAAGYRPAYGVDDPAAPLTNAQGKELGITVGRWLSARGQVKLSSQGSNPRAIFLFSGLVPRGRYSMFENHFTPSGISFTPLDGTGKTNSFTAGADGNAKLALIVAGQISRAEGVLLVYHSDGMDHGMERGEIGVNAHHQLIMRMP